MRYVQKIRKSVVVAMEMRSKCMRAGANASSDDCATHDFVSPNDVATAFWSAFDAPPYQSSEYPMHR